MKPILPKNDEFNMVLRSRILQHSIILEKTTALIITYVLRVAKASTKTLGNKSSSLGFRTKVDLLHDLGELTDQEYNHLIKFLEIRNQFAHNFECSYFTDVQKVNSDITKYLTKNFPNKEKDIEKGYQLSYKTLYTFCADKTFALMEEYREGVREEIMRYVDHKVYSKLDGLISEAFEEWTNKHKDTSEAGIVKLKLLVGSPLKSVNEFISELRSKIAAERTAVLKAEDVVEKAFSRKKQRSPVKSKDTKEEQHDKEGGEK